MRACVCGDCFDTRVVPLKAGGQVEQLLCSTCGVGFDLPSPQAVAATTSTTAPSPWEVLGVAPNTPLPDVRRAYLALVAQYHPDNVAQLGAKLQALAQDETRRIIEAWAYTRTYSLKDAAGNFVGIRCVTERGTRFFSTRT